MQDNTAFWTYLFAVTSACGLDVLQMPTGEIVSQVTRLSNGFITSNPAGVVSRWEGGKRLWSRSTESPIRDIGVAGNRIFVSGASLKALQLEDGSQLWDYEAGLSLATSIAQVDEESIVICPDNQIHLLSITGKPKVAQPLDGACYDGRLAVQGSLIFAPLSTTPKGPAGVTLIGTNGMVAWTRRFEGAHFGYSPVLVGTNVVFATDKLIVALDSSGSEVWRYADPSSEAQNVSTVGSIRGGPQVIDDSRIAIVGKDSGITCLDGGNGKVVWTLEIKGLDYRTMVSTGRELILWHQGKVRRISRDGKTFETAAAPQPITELKVTDDGAVCYGAKESVVVVRVK